MQEMVRRSPFAKRAPIADPRRFRPRTLAAAKEQIAEYYAKCGWDERSQLKWHEMCGVRTAALAELDLEETQKIIDRMRKGHMLLYRDWPD